MNKSVLRVFTTILSALFIVGALSPAVINVSAAELPQPLPSDSSGEYTDTGDWDGGTKANVTTITDRYNVTAGDLELDFPYAEKDGNLISYWRQEDDTDETGTNDLTNTGADYTPTGKFGGAYDYVLANTDYMYRAGKFDTGAQGTISIWVNLDNIVDAHVLFGYGGGGTNFLRFWAFADQLYFDKRDGWGYDAVSETAHSLTAGTWTHIAITNDGAWQLYVNGLPRAMTVDGANDGGWWDSVTATNPTYSSIGGWHYNGAWSAYSDAFIDEVKLYDRALNDADMLALYNSGLQYLDEGNWTSPLITPPAGDVLNNITIDLNNSWAGNCIDKIELLNSTDDVISTDTTDLTTNGTIIRDRSTFDNGFNGTYDNASFKVKIYLKGPNTYTPILQLLNYTTLNYSISSLANIKWDGNPFADVDDPVPLTSIMSYNETLAHKILFEPGETVYFNSTMALSQSVINVVVNVTIFTAADVFLAELINITWSFTENIVYNLTDIGGDLVNWTTSNEGLYYVNVYIYKTGEVNPDNDTNFFMVQETHQTLNLHTNTTNITNVPRSQMSIGESLFYNGTFQSTADQTFWVNASVYDSETGAWILDLIPNTSFSTSANIKYNMTTEFNANAPIYVNASDYTPDMGEHYIKTTFNNSDTFENLTSYAQFTIMEPMLEIESTIWDWGIPSASSSMGPEGSLSFTTVFNTDIPIPELWVNISAFESLTGNWIRTLIDNMSIDMAAYYSYNITDDLNGGNTIFLNGTDYPIGEYLITAVWNSTGTLTDRQTYSQFSVVRATAFVNASAYNGNTTTSANLTNQFNLSETVYFNGTIGTTYNITDAIINININNATMWFATLYNGTHSFTANANESLTAIAGGVLNYTTAIEGEYKLIIEVYKAGAINRTIVTEGFTFIDLVRNELLPGFGIKYIDPCFFEWKLAEALTVNFFDRTKTFAATDIISYIWNFGDGQGGTGMNTEHQYQMPGEYNVTMIAYYADGTVESFTTEVRVVDNAVSWFMYMMVGFIVFVSVLAVGTHAVQKKSKRLAQVMYIILGTFLLVSVVAMQMFVA